MKKHNKTIAILGISSWIGYLLSQKVLEAGAENIFGSSRTEVKYLPAKIKTVQTNNTEKQFEFVCKIRPTVLYNMLRGETVEDYELHCKLVQYCHENNCLYVYASSVLTLDGYKRRDLTEMLPPQSISPYGIFKARCEEAFGGDFNHGLIIRFSSIHGFVPHKLTRTGMFLQKLCSGEEVAVDEGVLQNRLYDLVLIEMILKLVDDHRTGVWHLGTVDSSSEIGFRRELARSFGLNPSLVVPGKKRDANLFALPGRVLTDYGDTFRYSEKDTLNLLMRNIGLQKYTHNK
jgi:dTDP-4-dehydrorhamnose reductase